MDEIEKQNKKEIKTKNKNNSNQNNKDQIGLKTKWNKMFRDETKKIINFKKY